MSAAQLLLNEFNEQGLANTAWAFATVGEPAPELLNPISVLDTMEKQGEEIEEFNEPADGGAPIEQIHEDDVFERAGTKSDGRHLVESHQSLSEIAVRTRAGN